MSAASNEKARLLRMMEVETLIRRCRDHVALEKQSSTSPQNFAWREKVAQWFYDVAGHLNESREVAYVAINILDRYISVNTSHDTMDKDDYELAAITALFLAVRVAGSTILEVPDLLQMSRVGVQVKDILSKGKNMLQSLTWEHRLITPADFVMAMISNLRPSIDSSTAISILESAIFLVELSVCDQYFIGTAPSKIAFASTLNAIKEHGICDAASSQFLERVQEETGLDASSSEIKAMSARLRVVYCQSEENLQTTRPNVIADDLEFTQINDISRPYGARVVFYETLYPSVAVTLPESDASLVRSISPFQHESTSKRARFN
jgi:hypothetical protein